MAKAATECPLCPGHSPDVSHASSRLPTLPPDYPHRALMPLRHLFLALTLVFIWGTNFPLMKVGLLEIEPLTFATLRFAFTALPFVFFLPRPKVRWLDLAVCGLLLGVGEFGFMYWAIHRDITPGLASLTLQTQVFFTIGLAMLVRGDRVKPLQWLALVVALVGMGIIAEAAWSASQDSVTLKGLMLMLAAALSWAGANVWIGRMGRIEPLGFMAWISVFATPVLFAWSLATEGTQAWIHLADISGKAWGSVAWQAFVTSLFGYGVWNWLLARHPASTVTPMALLVPIFGMGTSALVLGESLPLWKIAAASLVITGLVINVLASRPSPFAKGRVVQSQAREVDGPGAP